MTMRPYLDEFGNKVNPGQYFLGGGSPSLPKQEPVKVPQTPAIEQPKPLPPPAPIPPPPTTSNLEVQQAQTYTKQQAARRNGIRKSLIAGETGGYLGTSSDPTKKSLLG